MLKTLRCSKNYGIIIQRLFCTEGEIMVKAELTYNPYLMEMNVKFNDQAPRINSLIEKYKDIPLEDWINLVPQIFYDEMNGYFFELDFSGTQLDCEEIRSSFRKARVSEDEVTVFLKNELEPREEKVKEIDSLLEWLQDNHNRKFDYPSFRHDYRELFDDDYTYITIHSPIEETEYEGISIENVESVNELDCTDLTHIPVLFFVTTETVPILAKDIKYILNRDDVSQKQLFFFVSKDLKRNKIRRILIDLGVKEPNIVSGILDDTVEKYFMLYPVSDYISDAIKVFRIETDKISAELDEENKKSELEGKEIHTRLDIIENSLQKLKDVDEKITQRDNLEIPSEFNNIKSYFFNQLSVWRNTKTIITRADEAYAVATDFNADLHRFYGDLCTKIDEETIRYADDIRRMYSDLYGTVDSNDSFADKIVFSQEEDYPIIEEQTYVLLKLKEENYVEHKTNFIGQLFKQSDNNTNKDPVLETTYFYKIWRSHMMNAALPAIDKLLEKRFALLKQYSDELADVYHEQLVEMIAKKKDEKNTVASQLSEEEKILQEDNDWLTSFMDQLKVIERS